jgi:hypothetical protein
MNNPFTNRMAAAFASRIINDAGRNKNAQITEAYRLALGRKATADEVRRATKAIADGGIVSLCWALLNSAEFAYLR